MKETTQLNALIVDDQNEVCIQLKTMLERIGISQIAIAHDGNEAILALSQVAYDLVLCDYNLGNGKDGLQVLEESTFSKTLKNTACFIIVTASQSGDVVLGAIEHQPDAYILKPVTFDDLRLRLERTLNVKTAYHPINSALDRQDYVSALEFCDVIINSRPKLRLPIYKIKAKILIDTKNYKQAEKLFLDVLSVRKLSWALFGLAKSLYYQNRFDEAEKLLKQLISSNSSYAPAYDLLSKIQEQKGDQNAALKILVNAVNLSPRVLYRQSELSRIATLSGSWETAIDASRKGVELGRYSCFKDSSNYINLATALKPQLKNASMNDRHKASTEILKTMDYLKRDFRENPEILISANFIKSSIHNTMGHNREGLKYERIAKDILQTNNSVHNLNSLNIICHNLSKTCSPQTLTTFIDMEICQNFQLNPEQYKITIPKTIESFIEQDTIDKYNNQGVEYFQKGALNEAIQMFDKATEYAHINFSVLLNAAQANISFIETNGVTEKPVKACNSYFNRLKQMPNHDRRYARKQRLESIFSRLQGNEHGL